MTPEQLALFPDFTPTNTAVAPLTVGDGVAPLTVGDGVVPLTVGDGVVPLVVAPDEVTVAEIPDSQIEQYELTKHKELLASGFNLINNHFDGVNHHYTYRKES